MLGVTSRRRGAARKNGHPPSSATAPLLFAFVAPTIGVVGLVGWIATGGGTWLAVAASLVLVIVMMAGVMVTIGRLLADDADTPA